ncbi:MAG TPA: response regulator [Polyangiales bacterium]|nr:response regulator [Polyangiales bacterium]
MIDVLIVDDDEIFGQLTLERIETLSWSAMFHKGPFGTVNAIRAAKPRLIIMDVNMPGLDGAAIYDLLRKQDVLQDTRVLLMSSLEQRELEAIQQEHAIDASLPKSATRAELAAAIAQLIGGRRSLRTGPNEPR